MTDSDNFVIKLSFREPQLIFFIDAKNLIYITGKKERSIDQQQMRSRENVIHVMLFLIHFMKRIH